jgi:hypothetical protein
MSGENEEGKKPPISFGTDGSIEWKSQGRPGISIDPSGNAILDPRNLKGIALGSVIGVKTHNINRVQNRIIHHIIYDDGTEFEVTYREIEEREVIIENFEARGGSIVQISKNNILTLYPRTMPRNCID